MNNFNKTGVKNRLENDSKRANFSSPPKTSNGLRESYNGVNSKLPVLGYFNVTSNAPFDIVKYTNLG